MYVSKMGLKQLINWTNIDVLSTGPPFTNMV